MQFLFILFSLILLNFFSFIILFFNCSAFSDFEIKRVKPGEIGIQPNQIKKLIGRKLKNSILKDQIFKIEDFYSLNEKN